MKNPTMNKDINIETIGRPELIEALRYELEPTLFREILSSTTAELRGILAYARARDRGENVPQPAPVKVGRSYVPPTKITLENVEDLFKGIIESIEAEPKTLYGFPVHVSTKIAKPIYRRTWYGKRYLYGFDFGNGMISRGVHAGSGAIMLERKG